MMDLDIPLMSPRRTEAWISFRLNRYGFYNAEILLVGILGPGRGTPVHTFLHYPPFLILSSANRCADICAALMQVSPRPRSFEIPFVRRNEGPRIPGHNTEDCLDMAGESNSALFMPFPDIPVPTHYFQRTPTPINPAWSRSERETRRPATHTASVKHEWNRSEKRLASAETR